jgi:AraC family transcriptional regulator
MIQKIGPFMHHLQPNDQKRQDLRNEYIARINRVIDYIESNLDQELTLAGLADVAHFSRFHFHRIFSAIVGETLNRFIQRNRLEKAASQLVGNPKKTITEIAFDCGFSGSAVFSRAFREAYDTTPSKWRADPFCTNGKIQSTKSKIRQTNRKIRQDMEESSVYIDTITNNPTWRIKMKDKDPIQIEVKKMPEMSVAYVRHIGPYKGDEGLFAQLFQKLCTWAGPRGLLRFPETQMLAVYHDNPEITDEDKLRTSVCISVSPDTTVDGDIGKMTMPGGQYAVARFELTGSDQYEGAWKQVMGDWLPESGYQPDDRVCYENYRNNPEDHPEGIHIVDICVPVKPL